jgi:hypothetical protein
MKGNSRKNGTEQYYTLPEVALSFTKPLVETYGTDFLYVEPCGGKGAFIDALIACGVPGKNVLSWDIEPKDPRVAEADFLLDRLEIPNNAIFVTNPPYGRACSLAVNFFNKAASYNAKAIAFLIPASFNKVAISDRLNRKYQLKSSVIAPKVSYFTETSGTNERGRLSTEFQTWELSATIRPLRKHLRHPWIEFVAWARVRNGSEYDFCIRTHGSGCGEILDKNYSGSLRRNTGESGSHLNFRTVAFVRSNNPSLRDTLSKMDFTRFSNAVSYIPCISPAEICILLSEVTGIACEDKAASLEAELVFDEESE